MVLNLSFDYKNTLKNVKKKKRKHSENGLSMDLHESQWKNKVQSLNKSDS